MPSDFTDDEISRYTRQIMVRDFGGAGQRALKSAHIAVIGMGGIGTPVALYLAAAGVGRIDLYDDDVIDPSNLQRQILYTTADIGEAKAETAATRLRAINPNIEITPHGRFDETTETGATLWIDGTDRISTRLMINARAGGLGAQILGASLAQWEGQILHSAPRDHAGCLACLHGETSDAAIPNCAEAGIIGPVAGMIGTMAALEAIKIIADIKPLGIGQMMLIDGLYRETRVIKVTPRADCAICSSNPENN